MAKRPDDAVMTKQDRLALSYKVFTDKSFRKRLFIDPQAAAAEIGIVLPRREGSALRKHRNRITRYCEAVDTLVRLGKDVTTLWRDKNIGILGINGIAAPGDWDPNFPPPDWPQRKSPRK